jgi:hypothetical protein
MKFILQNPERWVTSFAELTALAAACVKRRFRFRQVIESIVDTVNIMPDVVAVDIVRGEATVDARTW